MAREDQNSRIHFVEDEQTEKIRHWWKKNGTSIIVGLVLGVGSVAGYQGWGIYQNRQAEVASDLYQDMLRHLEEGALTPARESSDRLILRYTSTVYSDAALLMLAKLDVEAGHSDQAARHLNQVIEDSKDTAMRHIARLRLAVLALDSGDLDRVDQLLEIDDKGSFESHYDELRGDVSVARNDLKAARNAYQSALDKTVAGSVAERILERKMNSVTRVDDR
jgi:predicted negative regulator of RcsB-dependent stress response